jgi:hypothetical protein
MPTNILRKQSKPSSQTGGRQTSPRKSGLRRVLVKSGRVSVTAELLDTPTADRIWAALPVHSSAEPFGSAIQFEVPVESGRERGAKILATLGELYFWSEEDRVVLVFGPTPISRPGEIRLQAPCNVWARTSEDLSPLKKIGPGEKISLIAT